jgi:hypothetical protein
MAHSARLRWLINATADLFELPAPTEVEQLFRDPDAFTIVYAFLRCQVDAIVFFYQPKEVRFPAAITDVCRGCRHAARGV